MRILARSLVFSLLAVFSFLLAQQSTVAATMDDVTWPTLTGVVEGQVVFTQVTASSSSSEQFYRYTVALDTANSSASITTLLGPGQPLTLDLPLTLSAGDIQECAVTGSLTITVTSTFEMVFSTPTVQIASATIPCSLYVPLAVVTPIAPLLAVVCGPNNDYIELPAQWFGVEYALDEDGSDGVVGVEFFPAENYVFPEGTQTFYQFVDENTSCTPITPVRPMLADVCGPNNDVLIILGEPFGLVEIPGDWVDGTMILTYLPDFGYSIAPGAESVFTYYDSNTPCVAPVMPVVTTICGPNNDEIDLSVQPENVLLAGDSGWMDGSRWVEFMPAAGVGLDPTADSGFVFIDEAIPCPPVTPTPTPAVRQTPEPTIQPTTEPTVQPVGTPLSTPTVMPTVEPTTTLPPAPVNQVVTTPGPSPAPVETPAPVTVAPPAVTGLPNTGSGTAANSWMIVAGIVMLAAAALGISRQRSS